MPLRKVQKLVYLPKEHWKIVIQNIDPKISNSFRVFLYILIIFATGIASAFLIQKIYKRPYQQSNLKNYGENYMAQSNHASGDYFDNVFGIPLFVGFFGMFYGFINYQIMQRQGQERQDKYIPFSEFMKISSMDVVIQTFFYLAILLSSFNTVNLFNACTFLPVVLVGILSIEISNNLKMQKRQIGFGLIVVFGIIAFNMFGSNDEGNVNKSLNIWSFLLIIAMLLTEGLRPRVANEFKQKYGPSPSLYYYQISKYSFFILLILSILTTQFFKLVQFIWNHDSLALDLMSYAFLDIVAYIFLSKLLNSQQHIFPIVFTIRKLLATFCNIFYFQQQIQPIQTLALGLVGGVILLELYISYNQNRQKFEDVSKMKEKSLGLGNI